MKLPLDSFTVCYGIQDSGKVQKFVDIRLQRRLSSYCAEGVRARRISEEEIEGDRHDALAMSLRRH